MDRLTDDDLIELLGTLGVLRLEVQELRKSAEQMVPKDELENRGKRIRLAGFIASIVLLIIFIPFGYLVHQNSDNAHEAKKAAMAATSGQQSLVQDQYDRSVTAEKSCNDRNATQVALSTLIQKLLDAEQHARTPDPERIDAYRVALQGTNTLADCGVYDKQQQSLIAQGANPNG